MIRVFKVYKIPMKIYNYSLTNFFRLKYYFIKNKIHLNNIMSIENTIDEIINNRVSISRFGDGEFKWMDRIAHDSFQKDSELISVRLKEVISSNEKNHLVGISPAFKNLNYCEVDSKKYWSYILGKYGLRWSKYLNKDKVYYNANISRFYINNINKNLCEDRFNQVKRIWEGREVLIVEGEKSRLGVGNDLFENASNIKRLLAPAHNAFDQYTTIFEKAKKFGKGKLILLALGPTATILAYDLAKDGYQAVDIGHIDIEYEWFLMGARTKVPIAGREVNEARTREETLLHGKYMGKYESEIIDII